MPMTQLSEIRLLRALARWHGIQTTYGNLHGHRVHATIDTLRALLDALGVPASSPQQCVDSLRASEQGAMARLADDVLVAWDGVFQEISWGGDGFGDERPDIRIVLENGTGLRLDPGRLHAGARASRRRAMPGAAVFRIVPALHLPPGYHHLQCTLRGKESTSLLLSAPTRCYNGEAGEKKSWGLFAPLYALRSDTDPGAGSYSELLELIQGTVRLGGGIAGTLPLLPCFYRPGQDPSPYRPVSRLLWSELYIDVARLSHGRWADAATEVLNDSAFIERATALRRLSQVDYIETLQLKREMLRSIYARISPYDSFHHSLEQFCAHHHHVAPYATFRAAGDESGRQCRGRPEGVEEGAMPAQPSRRDEVRLRQFEQWLAHSQMADCIEAATSAGARLYLDLPIGVHPDGYDAWRYRDAFVAGASIGAPPDIVFTTGQQWDSPPIHPEGIRRRQYDYVREYLAHHMRAAQMLRIDHVMGLHRIYCIPQGAATADGAYIRYRPEEWYAILSLESHRHRTVLVGEDLGLVPVTVRRAMSRHGLNRMFVLYYELDGIAAGTRPALPRNCLASLNTHDMPTFAAMWQGLDIRQHERLGMLKPGEAPELFRSRERALRSLVNILRPACPDINGAPGLDTVLRCTLKWLGSSRARYLVANLEDLWQETERQNLPGLGDAYPSWRHRTRMTLQHAWSSPMVQSALEALRQRVAVRQVTR